MTERLRALREPGSCVSGLMRSAEAVGRGEAVLTRKDAEGDEAVRIRERLAVLAEEKDRLEAVGLA